MVRLRTINLLIVTLCLGLILIATPDFALASGDDDHARAATTQDDNHHARGVADDSDHAKHGHGGVNLEKAKGDACIKDTEWMRRNHMKLLMHKRAVTVREGVRTPAESLLQCQSCHQKREAFCDRCHSYVGVKPDCFECHNY